MKNSINIYRYIVSNYFRKGIYIEDTYTKGEVHYIPFALN